MKNNHKKHQTNITKVLLGLAVSGFATGGIAAKLVQAYQVQSATAPTAKSAAIAAASPTAMPNGAYLYGQVPQPNQIRQAYVVFQHHNGKVVGAVFEPRSEFSCFAGTADPNALQVKTVGFNSVPVTTEIELSSLHPIMAMSDNDQRILATCKQDTAQLAKAGALPQGFAQIPSVRAGTIQ